MIATSRSSFAQWLPLAPIVLLAGAMYFWKLSSAPVYLGGDEARFGINAYAIASSGRDLNGRFMPLLVRLEDVGWWYQPMLFYLIAGALKIFPLSEGAIRIPTVVIGLLDVCLVYGVIRNLLPGRWYPAAGAAMLALTPAHFMFSREARDFICVLPFVLGWLWCVLSLMEADRVGVAVLAGALLGIGIYTHIAAWVFMPLYAVFTCAVLILERRNLWLALWTIAAFLVAALPLLVWLRSHPGMIASIVGGYHVYDAHRLSPLQGVKDLLNYNSIQERLSVYWDYFNPAYLFFSGGSNLTVATRRAGVFPLAQAAFLACGVYDLWTKRRSPVAIVLLAGLATAPLGATLVADRYAIQRELVVIPFGVLVGMFGVAWLVRHRNRMWRAAAVLLLASIPIQFVFFYRDYLTGYQVRSAYWFDPNDFRDIAEYLIANASSRDVEAVYVSSTMDDAIPRWRFYLAKHGRDDLWPRTHFFSRDNLDIGGVRPGSLLVLEAKDSRLPDLVGPGKCCSVAHRVKDVGGSEPAVILVR